MSLNLTTLATFRKQDALRPELSNTPLDIIGSSSSFPRSRVGMHTGTQLQTALCIPTGQTVELRTAYAASELAQEATVAKYATVRAELFNLNNRK